MRTVFFLIHSFDIFALEFCSPKLTFLIHSSTLKQKSENFRVIVTMRQAKGSQRINFFEVPSSPISLSLVGIQINDRYGGLISPLLVASTPLGFNLTRVYLFEGCCKFSLLESSSHCALQYN